MSAKPGKKREKTYRKKRLLCARFVVLAEKADTFVSEMGKKKKTSRKVRGMEKKCCFSSKRVRVEVESRNYARKKKTVA